MDRRRKAALNRDKAARLNEAWKVGAAQARYSDDGHWYAVLSRFPAALFDANGYVVFDTQDQYRNSPYLKIGKQISVPKPGISAIPDYVRVIDPHSASGPHGDLPEPVKGEARRQYLQYWRPDTVDANLEHDGENLVEHIAGNRLGHINRGDVVWVVTIRSGELRLIGRILVDAVVDQAEAERRLGRADLWEATHHALVVPGTAEPIRDDSIADLAGQLTFESAKSSRLTVVRGRVNPQQLQAIRRLTPEGAALLQERWGGAAIPAGDASPPGRREAVILRIIRDSSVAERVKRLHDYRCQVCGVRLETPGGPYAEGAHICPLGGEHGGLDVAGNILCLCPNDHVLFDRGGFTIEDDMTLRGCHKGKLRTVKGHVLDSTGLRYHRANVYRDG